MLTPVLVCSFLQSSPCLHTKEQAPDVTSLSLCAAGSALVSLRNPQNPRRTAQPPRTHTSRRRRVRGTRHGSRPPPAPPLAPGGCSEGSGARKTPRPPAGAPPRLRTPPPGRRRSLQPPEPRGGGGGVERPQPSPARPRPLTPPPPPSSRSPVVLRLEELELLLDAVERLRDGEFERLARSLVRGLARRRPDREREAR